MKVKLIIFILVTFAPAAALAEEEPSEDEATDAEAEPEEALLRVVSHPLGAPITIDNHNAGQTPATLAIEPGRHVVIVGTGTEQVRTNINAVRDELVEITVGRPALERNIEPWLEEPRPYTVRQARDTERVEPTEVGEPELPRARRIPTEPIFSVHGATGFFTRNFGVSIDSTVDPDRRSRASLETAPTAALGFQAALYPFARSSTALIRHLGIQAGATFAVGLDVRSGREEINVDASYYEADVSAVYGIALGTSRVHPILSFQVGWHRTAFDLGREGNDTVPPFAYDAARIGVNFRFNLGTPHIVANLGGALLLVSTPGAQAERAYGLGEPETTAGEVSLGVIARINIVELGVGWIGRWMSSAFSGTGEGWGELDNPNHTIGYRGITTVGDASDSYQQLRINLGIRY